MGSPYPPVGFRFGVVIDDPFGGLNMTEADGSFQEVAGIRVEFGTEDVTEGGENRFVHRLPTAARYANLILKRGVVTAGSPFADWVETCMNSGFARPISTRNLLITLRDEKNDPLVGWSVVNAYPIRWETDPLNAMENTILTETMELAYSYFDRLTPGKVSVWLADA